jgi:murein DD-endopeptidase MepM/ murein hydrolase activator NlpD
VISFDFRQRLLISVFGAIVVLGLIWFYFQKTPLIQEETASPQLADKPSALADPEKALPVWPVAEFEERITRKPFGIYITPETSPVQPERFSGYHTGVDVEYEDVKDEVPVLAVCDGEVVSADWVSGYGGTVILKCDFNDQALFLVYGHLDPASFISQDEVKKGDQIAILGKGQTRATDFERKHLHFAVKKGELDLRGYVSKEEALNQWLNPIAFFSGFQSS